MNYIKILIVVLTMIALSACSSLKTADLKPWEKGDLARKEMAFITDPLGMALKDHIYFSKEASSSGSAVSGGGCGCN